MMLLQSHQQLEILREEDASIMTTSGDVKNLFGAEHGSQLPVVTSEQPTSLETADGINNCQLTQTSATSDGSKEQQAKQKRKNSVFSMLGGYRFRKSVPQCRKETRSSSWTAIAGDNSGSLLDDASFFRKNQTCGSLCDGLMLRPQEMQNSKQVFPCWSSTLPRNSSFSAIKSKSNSLPRRPTYESNSLDRQDFLLPDGCLSFQQVSESDTADESDVTEDSECGPRCSLRRSNTTRPDTCHSSQLSSTSPPTQGYMRWKKVANKLGIDNLKKAIKDGLSSPSNPGKSPLKSSTTLATTTVYTNTAATTTITTNNSCYTSTSTPGQRLAENDCRFALSAVESTHVGARPSKTLHQQHTRRASVAVESIRESSSSSSIRLASPPSSLHHQHHLTVSNTWASCDSDSDLLRDGKSRHLSIFQHRNLFQSNLQASQQQQQHLQKLHHQQQQQAFHESLQKVTALDVLFLHQSEAEAWSLTVSPSRLTKLTDREIKFQNHIWELIQTEKNHLRTLMIMQKVFVNGLIEEVRMSERMIDKLFPSLHDIIFFHYSALTSLLSLQDASQDKTIFEIGSTLCNMFSGASAETMKKIYGDFCARHSEALQVYKESLKNDLNFQRFIKKCSINPQCKRLTVPECILLVAQRPTKYPLLIEPILDAAQKASEEQESLRKCLALCRSVLDEIDHEIDSKNRHTKLLEISNRVDSKSSILVKGQALKKSDVFLSHRLLVMEGHMKWVLNKHKQQDVYVVLLSDILLFFIESGQKLAFFVQENKPSLIGLKSLLVRDKGDSRDGRGLYLICHSDSPVPEMHEFAFRTSDNRNRWSAALKAAISAASRRYSEGRVADPTCQVYSCGNENIALANEGSVSTRKNSFLDESALNQLRSLVDQLNTRDAEICHLLDEKMKTFWDILKVLSPEDCMERYFADVASFQDCMNIAFTEGTRLLGLSSLSPISVGSVDSCLSHDFDDVRDATSIAMSANVSTILPKRAETFAGFDNKKPSKEGNIAARPSSATLSKKMMNAGVSNVHFKSFDHAVSTSSSSAMQSSICSTTSGVRSSSFEGQSSSFDGQCQVLNPSQCAAVGKLLSAVQKISVQAIAQLTEIQSLRCQLAEMKSSGVLKKEQIKSSEKDSSLSSSSPSSSPSSSSVLFQPIITSSPSSLNLASPATTSTMYLKLDSPIATTSRQIVSSSAISSTTLLVSVTSSFVTSSSVTSSLVTSSLVTSSLVTSSSLIASTPVTSVIKSPEKVKIVRPNFLPFSPMKFQPLFTKRPISQHIEGLSTATTQSSSFLPPASSSSLVHGFSSLPTSPCFCSSLSEPQTFPKSRSFCTDENLKSSAANAERKKFNHLSVLGERSDFEKLNVENRDVSHDACCVGGRESTSTDSKITILIDSCPIVDDDVDFFNNTTDGNNFKNTNNKQLHTVSSQSCRELSTTAIIADNNSSRNSTELQKSLSAQTVNSECKRSNKTNLTRTKSHIIKSNSNNIINNNQMDVSNKTSEQSLLLSTSLTSLSLYFV